MAEAKKKKEEKADNPPGKAMASPCINFWPDQPHTDTHIPAGMQPHKQGYTEKIKGE